MNETFYIIVALVMGVLLGAVFFGGLWWTVQKLISSKRPAFWFFCSLLLRTGITLIGFYLIAQGHFDRFLVCLFGFIIARFIIMQLTKSGEKSTHLEPEAGHAP